MPLLNRKIDYALLILCYLHHKSEAGCACEIASRFGISRPFVANILKDLCHQGYVSSHRGVKGGYLLRPHTSEATLADLIDALDDTVQLAECILAALRGVRDAFCGGLHLRDCVRVGHQLADSRIEEILDRIDLDIAPGEHPRQHFRQLVALRDRERPRRAPRIEPVAPDLAGRGVRHAQKRGRQLERECRCRKRHGACSR